MKHNLLRSLIITALLLSACTAQAGQSAAIALTTTAPTGTPAPTNTPAPTLTPTPNMAQLKDEYGWLGRQTDKLLVFQKGDFSDITVTNTDGSNPLDLTASITGHKTILSLSPDNKWLVFDVTETSSRSFTGQLDTTTQTDIYIVSTTDPTPQFLSHGTVETGNDSTTWNKDGTAFMLNCPYNKMLIGLCQIKIQPSGITWENLNMFGQGLTKVNGDMAVFTDTNGCLFRIDISDATTQKLLCGEENVFIRNIIPTQGNTILVQTEKYQDTWSDTSFQQVDISTGESKKLFGLDGHLGYDLFTDRSKNQVAGCVEPTKGVQPTLFLYNIGEDKLYQFIDTTAIVLQSMVKGKTFDCNRLYFLWNKTNELNIIGEIPQQPNTWTSDFSGSTIKCYTLNFDTEKISVNATCIYKHDDYY